jgi:phage tail sheath protein FI
MVVRTSYPGVYIHEVPSGVHTITGVATSIAAFFGEANEGPVNKPERLLKLADLEDTFGPPDPDGELHTAVRLFFQNGGTECYVVRVAKKGTGQAAFTDLKNEKGTDVLKLAAKEAGVWGNELTVEVDYNTTQPEDTFHLYVRRIGSDGTVKALEEIRNCSMDPDSDRFAPDLISLTSKLVDGAQISANAPTAGSSEARLPFVSGAPATKTEFVALVAEKADPEETTSKFNLSVDGSAPVEVDLVDAAGGDLNALRDDIKTKIDDVLPAGLKTKVTPRFHLRDGTHWFQLISATADKVSIKVTPATTNDLTVALVFGSDQGGLERSRYSVLRPAPSGISLKLDKTANRDSKNIDKLALLLQSEFNEITLDGSDTPIDLINDHTLIIARGANRTWSAGRTTGTFDGVRERLAIIASAINEVGLPWVAKLAGSRLIVQKHIGTNYDLIPTISTAGGDQSALFSATGRYFALEHGTEPEAPRAQDYKGEADEKTGFFALDNVDLFNLMVIPRPSSVDEAGYRSIWGPASAYCVDRRAFLLIDPPETWKASYKKVMDPATGIRKLRIGVAKNNAAVFYPRINVRENGRIRNVGPAGAIAGLMSRIDSTRGVWKAPAGMDADIRSISGVETPLTDNENGVLNQQGVNCIRSFTAGIVNWGARTMNGADDFSSEWKYIPIRRLALFLEETLFRNTTWIVFEPNDEPLWAKIRLNLNAFMMGLFRQGAFQGSTPDTAFYVKCDGETTTEADRNLGIVNIEVGFAPLKPAEFVVIKIQQIVGDL